MRSVLSPVAVEAEPPLPHRLVCTSRVIKVEALTQIAADVGKVITDQAPDRLRAEVVGVEHAVVCVIASEVLSEALEQVPPLGHIHPLPVAAVVVGGAAPKSERRAVEIHQDGFDHTYELIPWVGLEAFDEGKEPPSNGDEALLGRHDQTLELRLGECSE